MSGPPSGEGVLAWRQLLRLGNVFTAASNVIAGYLIVGGGWEPAAPLAALVAASVLLYAAGMALNDAYDATLDASERPERPIPSGRVARSTAFAAGWSLMAVGIAAAVWAAREYGRPAPLIVAGCLALLIVMYDSGLKKTWSGPWAMGFCRALNVLLGGSLVEASQASMSIAQYAVALGLYTTSITYMARLEAGRASVTAGGWSKATMAAACGMLLVWPLTQLETKASQQNVLIAAVAMLAFIAYAAANAWLALRAASTTQIRRAVKRLLIGFILVDAIAATAAAGWPSGLAVLTLIIPTWIGARRAPMT